MGLLTDLISEHYKEKDEKRQNQVTAWKALINDKNARPEQRAWAIQQMLGEANVPKQAHGLIGGIFGHLLGQKQGPQAPGSAQTPAEGQPARMTQPQYNPVSGQMEQSPTGDQSAAPGATPTAPASRTGAPAAGPPTPGATAPARPPAPVRPGQRPSGSPFLTDEEIRQRDVLDQRALDEEALRAERERMPLDVERSRAAAEAAEELREPPTKTRDDGGMIQWNYKTRTWDDARDASGKVIKLQEKTGQLKAMQDPDNPEQQIYGRLTPGGTMEPVHDQDGNTVPVKAKTPDKPKLTGQLKELADANRILASKESTEEEKTAAREFKQGVNARVQVVLHNPNLAVPEDAELIGDAIINGDQPPTLTGLGRAGTASAVRAYLAKKNFNLAQAEIDWRATGRWVAAMNSAQQLRLRQATDFSTGSLDLLTELADKAEKEVTRSGKFPLFNRASMLVAKAGGEGKKAQDAAAELDIQITDLRAELATVYKGGNSPTDIGIKQAMDILDSSWTRSTLAHAIELAKRNLGLRLNSIRNTGVAGASSDNPYGPTPPPRRGTYNPATGKVEYN